MKNLIFRFRKRKKVKPYKVDTSQKGNDMLEETNALLKQILEELKAIREEVAPTRTKKVTHTANIDRKTIAECVTDGIQNALYGKRAFNPKDSE